jgi:hypothetical protein
LDKIIKEKSDQNNLNEFIEEVINLDWADNKEKENVEMIEYNLDNSPKVGISKVSSRYHKKIILRVSL